MFRFLEYVQVKTIDTRNVVKVPNKCPEVN